MKYDFTGKTVLVTGAGHGIGRAIAGSFAGLGAEVYALDVNEEALTRTAEETGCRTRALDVTDRVLRHRPMVPHDPHELRLPADSQQLPQLLLDNLRQTLVVVLQQFRL